MRRSLGRRIRQLYYEGLFAKQTGREKQAAAVMSSQWCPFCLVLLLFSGVVRLIVSSFVSFLAWQSKHWTYSSVSFIDVSLTSLLTPHS